MGGRPVIHVILNLLIDSFLNKEEILRSCIICFQVVVLFHLILRPVSNIVQSKD